MMLQTTHICFACKKKGDDIFPVIDHNHFSELCIYRRGLHILWTKGWFKSIAKISYMMGNSDQKLTIEHHAAHVLISSRWLH